MDAYDVARLIASQHPKAPKPRWGTVQSIAEKTLSVLPDGSTSPITVVRGCSPRVGGRVVMLVNGTEWIAVAQVGGDSVAPIRLVLTQELPTMPANSGLAFSMTFDVPVGYCITAVADWVSSSWEATITKASIAGRDLLDLFAYNCDPAVARSSGITMSVLCMGM